MYTLFTIQHLKDLATKHNANFYQDSNDTIRIVYKLNDSSEYTEMYFGSKEQGFKKYYN